MGDHRFRASVALAKGAVPGATPVVASQRPNTFARCASRAASVPVLVLSHGLACRNGKARMNAHTRLDGGLLVGGDDKFVLAQCLPLSMGSSHSPGSATRSWRSLSSQRLPAGRREAASRCELPTLQAWYSASDRIAEVSLVAVDARSCAPPRRACPCPGGRQLTALSIAASVSPRPARLPPARAPGHGPRPGLRGRGLAPARRRRTGRCGLCRPARRARSRAPRS